MLRPLDTTATKVTAYVADGRLSQKMRFTNGYVKMERSLISEFDGDVAQLGLLTLLMASVNWSQEPKKYTKMGITYDVKYGEYVTTYAILQESTGLSFRTLKGRLERLKTHGYISLKTLKNCMLIALCIDKCQFTCSTDVTTNEEYKNIRINRVPKGTMSKSPKNSQKKSDEFDSEGTKNLFNNPESGKNTPPEPERGVDGIFTPNDLFRLWNERRGVLPKATKLTKDRTTKCKLRLKENPDKDFWMTTIENLASSDFATQGKWANFDWILKNESNALKAFEGAYQNKKFVKVNPHAIQTEAAEIPNGW